MVTVRVVAGNEATSTTGSPSVTTAGGYTVYNFSGSGTLTWS